jgi:hypothetical protein
VNAAVPKQICASNGERNVILRLLPLLTLILLGACAADGPPGVSGPVRQLNAGKWTPGPGDLTVPPQAGSAS